MKLSDYVVDFLTKRGIKHSFLVQGGAVAHLADSTLRHPDMTPVCVQHEQFGAAAADGYARATGRPGLAMTTSGPGATNTLTSICNAYYDSIPMILITGQVARFRLRPNKILRQKGFQETDIVSIFESVTKYVKLVTDPSTIKYELEKALYLAQEGRQGPVVLDLPDDLQREEVDPETLIGFTPPVEEHIAPLSDIESLFQLISEASRPVIIFGGGVHYAKAEKEAIRFAHTLKIPCLLTWGGTDLLEYDDELNMGGVGVCGPRAGNFAAQNSDLVIAIGTRLSQQITGGKQHLFAPNAKKVMVDIDIEELKKFNSSTFELDLPIHSDLNTFFKGCSFFYSEHTNDRFEDWRLLIKSWKQKYPLCTKEDYLKKEGLNPYIFVKEFSKKLKSGDQIITDTGANICWVMQSIETKKNISITSAWNHTPMGYALPASIGAAFGSEKEIYCLIGDGGLMMCLQELATVSRYQLPIKIFIFDNKGQTTIKQTLETWLNGRFVGVDRESGLSFPNYKKLAETFDLPFFHIFDNTKVEQNLNKILAIKGPVVCQLEIDVKQRIVPILKFGSGLEDLEPRLPQEELDLVKDQALELSSETIKNS